ncbi:SdrD B-like domain-containing protein [Chloroflexota bacterium]
MLTVYVSPADSGKVKVNGNYPSSYPASYSFPLGTSVHVEALPATDSEFLNWSGSLTGNSNPVYINMNCSKSISANFQFKVDPGQVASISNFVWEDVNADGIQDSTELGIDDVLVELYGLDDSIIESVFTSGGGFYSFAGLQPGQYYLKFVAPEGYVFSPQDQGTDDMVDSDTSPDGQTNMITLSPGENDSTQDAGLYKTEIYTHDMLLVSGWNLISIPLIPESTDVEGIFAGIINNIETVWSYNGSTGVWHNYNPEALEPELSHMNQDDGYWVKVTDPCTVTIRGRKELLPKNITLSSGWNLIGLPFIAEPQITSDTLSSVMNKLYTTWSYDASSGVWHNYNPEALEPELSHMNHDDGYWVKVTDPCTLTIERILANINCSEAYSLIQEYGGIADFIIIDVRTPEEYANGHIEGAVNLDYYSATFFTQLGALNKNSICIIYCGSGGRSGITLEIMRDMRFREVYNMTGGINQWEAEGYTTVR